jgi:hypothetical protein
VQIDKQRREFYLIAVLANSKFQVVTFGFKGATNSFISDSAQLGGFGDRKPNRVFNMETAKIVKHFLDFKSKYI